VESTDNFEIQVIIGHSAGRKSRTFC